MSRTAAHRTHLEARLHEERERARRPLNHSVASRSGESEQDRAGDLASWSFHAADCGADPMHTELDASLATRVSRELAEIDEALAPLYGTPRQFGICEEAGRPISFERLDALPWAPMCGPQAG